MTDERDPAGAPPYTPPPDEGYPSPGPGNQGVGEPPGPPAPSKGPGTGKHEGNKPPHGEPKPKTHRRKGSKH